MKEIQCSNVSRNCEFCEIQKSNKMELRVRVTGPGNKIELNIDLDRLSRGRIESQLIQQG